MQVDREKLWIIQHKSNPVWTARFALGQEPSLTERKKLLGVKPETMATWLKKPHPNIDSTQLLSLITATNKMLSKGMTQLNPAHFEPDFPLRRFWELFGGDPLVLETILDDLFLGNSAGLTPHLIFDDEEIALSLLSRIKGLSRLTRLNEDGRRDLPIIVKSVHRIAKDQFVISASLAVPRGPGRNNPFFYRGIVCEIHDALYWVFSSIQARNKDMIFMVTPSIGHSDHRMKLSGDSLTVSQGDTSMSVSTRIEMTHVADTWPGGISEYYDEIMDTLES